ncbi:MAG: DNA translocase FtsK [Candidatus Calescibacterium sp.]|nr:DNA translocase FtsK [Candidatus Calescibacterium sp.]MCX7971922.1 DNA translocase FtsK [bacterium]MDW8194979.1 DNA translocase FtsK [Candidatus Calescibacterium sp.]
MEKRKVNEIFFIFITVLASLLVVLNFADDTVLLQKDKNLFYFKSFFTDLLGWNFILIPISMLFIGVYLIKPNERNFWIHLLSTLSLVFGFILLFPDPLSKSNFISSYFRESLGEILTFFISILMIIVPLIYIFDVSLEQILEKTIPSFLYNVAKKTYLIFAFLFKILLVILDRMGAYIIWLVNPSKHKKRETIDNTQKIKDKNSLQDKNFSQDKNSSQVNQSERKINDLQLKKKKFSLDIDFSEDQLEKNSLYKLDDYFIPSPFFLQSFVSSIYPRPKSNSSKDYSEILEETLRNFGIQSKVVDVQVGPSITRYELQIQKGVKVSQILRLKNDIALALAAIAVRIEAPIPGKSAIGIEVPNDKPIPVYLSDILISDEFLKTNFEIPIALGKDISGNILISDLTKTPHLLIAGSTGSGKTVCINSIICSMLFKFPPTKLQLLLIDPKMVELILYEGVPHIIEIVTDVKKASNALLQMVKIMEDRYKLFSTRKVRNIQEYNSLEDVEKLPYIVIIIDELADLMMTSAGAVEGHIARLTQLARAAGIHLIIATQRPSANVITGVIKANIPSRIAFAVASQVDSRVILDISGAENLIGRGDMLYMPIGSTRPIRAQGCFIGLKEIELIVKYWQSQPKPENLTHVDLDTPNLGISEDIDEDPELLKQAAKIILEDKRASTTMLQRKLRIGFAKAGRIMDILEKMNIVGPQEGSKPRKILIQNIEDIDKIFNK